MEGGTWLIRMGVSPQKYPMTPLNIIDLLLVLFCRITLIPVFKSPCAAGTRGESIHLARHTPGVETTVLRRGAVIF